MNLPLITSSLMNPLVQISNHLPKNSDRDMHASRTSDNSPSSKSIPLCFLDLWHNNPKAPENEKQKNIKPSYLIGRTKTYDYNVIRKEKDNNKKNTGNE